MEFVGLNKLTLVDFDDHISCTLFMQGCNFRCPFCHNASLVLDKNKEIPFEEVLSFLRKRVGILDSVVLTGGEPTLMPDLYEKISKIKSLGFVVKLDTNGTHPEVIKKLVEDRLVDYVAMDIKTCFDEYEIVTQAKVDLDKIKESILLLKSGVVNYEFRTTLVDELHSTSSIEKMAIDLNGAKKIRLQKFIDVGNCICQNLHEVSKSEAEKFVSILKNHIDDVALRGY